MLKFIGSHLTHIAIHDSQVATSRSRASVVVRASAESVDRRALLGVAAAGKIANFPSLHPVPTVYVAIAAFSAVLAAPAQAIKIPAQESYGGMLTGGGSMTKSSTAAVSTVSAKFL